MDAGTAEHVISQVQRELDAHVRTENKMTRTPKLASLAKAYDQLVYNVEADAEKRHNRISGLEARRPEVMAKVDSGIDTVDVGLDDIASAFETLTNGPPSPLDSSETSSGGPSTENPT